MGGLFSGPKATPINLPRPAPIPPIPQVEPETGDFARRSARKRSGFRESILAGSLRPPLPSEKKSVLG